MENESPHILLDRPEQFYDTSEVKKSKSGNLYTPSLNEWIRPIKRCLIPIKPVTPELRSMAIEMVELYKEIHAVKSEWSDIPNSHIEYEYKDALAHKIERLYDELTEMEIAWNNQLDCIYWLNTPAGKDWLSQMIDIGGDYVAFKDEYELRKPNKDRYFTYLKSVYLKRLHREGIDKYNKIIRSEIRNANEMAIMTQGVALAIGEPGSGKTFFITVWNFFLKYYMGKRSILDYPPKQPFGKWYQFTIDKLQNESELHRAIHFGKEKMILSNAEEYDENEGKPLTAQARHEQAVMGLLFRDACASLDEYGDYYPRYAGRTRIGSALFNFHRKWRHNNLLILGATPHLEDVDTNMCQKYITHHILVEPHPECPERVIGAKITPHRITMASSIEDVFVTSKHALYFTWDGFEPHDYLGGDCLFNLYNTQNPQRIKLSAKLTEKDL